MSRTRFSLSFPVEQPHDGLVCGNSDSGFIIFGSGNELAVCFALGSCWDRRDDQVFVRRCSYDKIASLLAPDAKEAMNDIMRRAVNPWNCVNGRWTPASKAPGGRITFRLNAALETMELDYRTGIITVRCAGGRKLKLTAGLSENVLFAEDPDRLIRSWKITASSENRSPWILDPKKIIPIREQMMLPKAEKHKDGMFQGLPQDPGLLMTVSPAPSGWRIDLRLAEKYADPERNLTLSAAKRELAAFLKNFYASAPSLKLPDPELDECFRMALYKFALATRPGGVPASLQGAWQEDIRRPSWSNDFHCNLNLQIMYMLAFPAGAPEHLLPLFDMLESEPFLSVMRKNAQCLFGIRDGLLLTHAVTDRGRQCGNMGMGSTLDFTCGGWTAMLYWWYCRYTLDEDFLRRRAYPMMKGFMNTYLAALRKAPDGKLRIPVSVSAEYGYTVPRKFGDRLLYQPAGESPTYQLASAHYLANAVIRSEKILKLKPDPRLAELKRKLPKFTLVDSPKGPRVGIMKDQDLDISHRHNSHLAWIYPFDLTGELDEMTLEILTRTLNRWIEVGRSDWFEGSFPWSAVIQNRTGSGDASGLTLDLWKKLFLSRGYSCWYAPKIKGVVLQGASGRQDGIMQLDGLFSGATAMLEFFAREQGGIFEIAPAVPSAWEGAEFSNISLPGGLKVSGRIRGGKPCDVTVAAAFTGKAKFRLGGSGKVIELKYQAGKQYSLK